MADEQTRPRAADDDTDDTDDTVQGVWKRGQRERAAAEKRVEEENAAAEESNRRIQAEEGAPAPAASEAGKRGRSGA